MEYEIRFYFSKKELNNLLDKLKNIKELKYSGRFYEKTIQYNTTDPNNDFYSKDIDGRFRLRITKGDNISKSMLSWKRRLKDTSKGRINKEEEKETRINPEDFDNFIYVVENVLKMNRVESYERYRNNFINEEVEISVDEYPFGIALEIESKKKSNQEEIIDKYVKLLNLKYEDSYRLSWDDKYAELCKKKNTEIKKDVLFEDKTIPEL